MSQLLEQFSSIIQQIVLTIGYPGITLIMITENIFPPIPSELVMPFGGFAVGQGSMSFAGVWIASVIGSVLGALLLYYVGWWAGDSLVRGFLRRYGRLLTLSERDYDRALDFFNKYGAAVIFFGRLIPLVRSLISLPAGADHMPLPKFLLLTSLGSGIWNGVLIYAGLLLGENWHAVIDFMQSYQNIVVIAFAAVAVPAVVWFIFARLRGRSRLTSSG